MGVDYTAIFGMGYQVAEKVLDEDDDFYMDEFLESLCEDKFEYFDTGQGSYTGECNQWYVVLKDPLKETLDLTEQKNELLKFLNDNEIDIIGNFGLQGGLLIH